MPKGRCDTNSAYLRDLCRFSRSSLSFNNNHLILFKSFFQFIKSRKDGKFFSCLKNIIIFGGKGSICKGICLGMENNIGCFGSLIESTDINKLPRRSVHDIDFLQRNGLGCATH